MASDYSGVTGLIQLCNFWQKNLEIRATVLLQIKTAHFPCQKIG